MRPQIQTFSLKKYGAKIDGVGIFIKNIVFVKK